MQGRGGVQGQGVSHRVQGQGVSHRVQGQGMSHRVQGRFLGSGSASSDQIRGPKVEKVGGHQIRGPNVDGGGVGVGE